jgi:hypothetical protein
MISDNMITDRIDEILKEKGQHNKYTVNDIYNFIGIGKMIIEEIDDIDEHMIFIDEKINSIISNIDEMNKRNKKLNIKININNINSFLINLNINLKTKTNYEIIAIVSNHIKDIEEKERKIQKKLRHNYYKICITIIVVMIITIIIMSIAIFI